MALDPKIQQILDRLNSRGTVATGMTIAENAMVELTVRELRTIAGSNPNHPSASVFLKCTEGTPPNTQVTIEQVQIDAITQDKHVAEDFDKAGRTIKVLVEPEAPTPAETEDTDLIDDE